MAKPAFPGSPQDPFIVPSPNSFHRAARVKPTAKRAVWQKPLQLARTPTAKKSTGASANVSTSAIVTPVKVASGPVQLPTPSTDDKETKLPQPAPFKRIFSLSRFTDPLPTPLRTPTCRLSVLEHDTPIARGIPLRFVVETPIVKEEAEAIAEVDVQAEVTAEVQVDVEKKSKPSRIPIWKGRKTGPLCPTCGTRTWSTASTVNVEVST